MRLFFSASERFFSPGGVEGGACALETVAPAPLLIIRTRIVIELRIGSDPVILLALAEVVAQLLQREESRFEEIEDKSEIRLLRFFVETDE